MNRKEIAAGLKSLGLKKGSIVMLHSSYLSLGKVENGPGEVVKAFLDVIGKTGTLLVPSFGKLGILVDEVKKLPGAVTSSCPASQIVACGPEAEALCADHWKAETAHGKGTPYTRLADKNGMICLLGVDQDRNTTLHSIEALLEFPYLRTIEREVTLPNGRKKMCSYRFFPGPHRNFIGIDRLLSDSGAMTTGRIGNAQVRLIRASAMFDVLLPFGKEHPDLFLCDNPACDDCTRQRAALCRDAFAKESFRLSASSRLAGRYVPEIIENLTKEGISYVELDLIQGQLCSKMPAERLAAIVKEFRDGGIEISALRLPALPDDPAEMAARWKEAGISRVILPTAGAAAAVKVLKKAGLEILAGNIAQTATGAATEFAAVNKADPKAKFAFNPANFAMVGEHPFLYSYRVGRFIKTIGQLDIVDALWDGNAAGFACGNGEIKELISILRCQNFSGWFSLGGGTLYPGSLQEAAENFRDLLATM